ncbi:MAG: tetratricopeptide repeat protein, partial [Vicinamibacterales bacterium]
MPKLSWWSVLGLVALPTLAAGQVAEPARRADSAQPVTGNAVVTRQGDVGDEHTYVIDLQEGSFFEASVSQEQAEVALSVSGPEGAPVASVDLPSLDPLPERLMFIAARTGTYRITVQLKPRTDLTGQVSEYTLRAGHQRQADDRDRRRSHCFAVTLDADRMAHRQPLPLAELGEVIAALERSSSCWRAESDAELETATLSSLAGLASLFAEFRLQSAAAFERLIPLLRASGRSQLELVALDDLIVEYSDDGRFDRMRETAIEAQRLAAELRNRSREGLAFRRLALAEFALGNYEPARRAALSTFDRATELNDEPLLARALLQLGRIDEVAGDYDAALAHYEQGLRAASTDLATSQFLRNALGFLHLQRGAYDAAAEQFEARLATASQMV